MKLHKRFMFFNAHNSNLNVCPSIFEQITYLLNGSTNTSSVQQTHKSYVFEKDAYKQQKVSHPQNLRSHGSVISLGCMHPFFK